MASKIARPAGAQQQDQKKVYLDWANHYLRKAGHSDIVLSDLRDISDGYYLPRVIKAVVSGDVPGVHENASTDEEKHENIEVCIKFLQGVGVSCSSFKPEDIVDGNMRAILSLFYNLSQFKKTAKTSSTSSISSSSSESVHTSKIARPVSPGLKASHGVSTGVQPASSLPKSSPAVVANGNTSSPAIGRRTAGSSILTATTYDRPYSQRRVPYKSVVIGESGPVMVEDDKDPAVTDETKDKPVANGHHASNGHPKSDVTESKLKPHSDTTETKSHSDSTEPKQRMSKLSKPVSHSHSSIGMKESKLAHPSATQSASQLKGPPFASEETKSGIAPPSRSKTLPHFSGGSKLQSPAILRKDSKVARGGGEIPAEAETNEVKPEDIQRPQSRLKMPGTGRSTPSSSGRSTPSSQVKSGLQRPSSRLSKSAISNDDHSESKLKLQRKGSDGAVKRHRVSNAITSVPGVGVIESGTSSLPHHLPRGITKSGSGLATPEGLRKRPPNSAHSSELELSTGSENSSSSASNEGGTTKNPPSQGLKKPTGGLRKPGGGFGFGARPPNTASETQATPTSTRDQREGGVSQESLLTRREESKLPEKKSATVERATSFAGIGNSRLSRFTGRTKLTPIHTSQPAPTEAKQMPGSTSSLDSTDIKLAESPKLDDQSTKVTEPTETVKPVSLEIADSQSSNSELISPPMEFKMVTKDEKEESSAHPRYGRRISPEGMSHEEATSPRDLNQVSKEPSENVEDLNRKNEELSDVTKLEEPAESDSNVPLSDSNTGTKNEKSANKLSQPETGQTESLESPQLSQKQGQSSTTPILIQQPSIENSDHRGLSNSESSNATARASRLNELINSPTHTKQRARSLSPKSSHRVIPSRSFVPVNFHGSNEIHSGSSEDVVSQTSGRSQLKSSLRAANSKKRNSSSSSVDSSSSSSPSRVKVTISPRSSQLVYDPGETGLGGSHGNRHVTKMSDRPASFADSSSSSLSPSGGVYHSQSLASGLTRHTSVRSTLSERLDYDEERAFLERGLSPKNEKGSNPEFELLGTFENQLTTMKKDLASKELMLSMYETSMADLSSKVHYLKKTLDEKDREIRQLTDDKSSTMSQWYDLEGRSLASRAASVAEVLSDGCLSDSAMDSGSKASKKKKKSWKFPFRKSKKDSKDHLSPNMDTESIMSGRSSRSLRRTLSAKRKTPDLMSISEYIAPRYRDPDTKSNYTLDARSEFAGGLPMIWADEIIEVYEDENPGAKVKVYLQPELDEETAVNDSGFYSDGLSRHGSNSSGIHKRDSFGSHSDDSVHPADNRLVLGTLSVAPETSWVTMDTKIGNIFMHHLNAVDQEGYLGLSEDSILCYYIGEQRRAIGNALLPLLTPYQAVSENNQIRILMRGAGQESCDSLAYKTLMNTETLQSSMNMLKDTQWLVVMGTKGTCKTSLSSGLSRHLSLVVSSEECEGVEEVEGGVGGEIVSFNVDKEGIETPLKYIKNDLVKRTQLHLHPPILLLEGIYECSHLEQVLVAAGSLHKRPYIIATLCSSTTKGIPLHNLMFHHQIRVITCNPSTEPVVGILARSLRKQVYQLKAGTNDLDQVAERMVNWLPYLLDHLNQFINKFHSNVVNLGPRVFMGCPLHQSSNELESWFLNLWNYFIIPYLMGTIMAGIETYTADPQLEWMDVREWVVESYPWQPSMNINKLRTLNPEDVGWNHAVRPQQNRLMILKDDDTRSLLHA